MDKTRETEQYLPYATDFILAPGEDLKKLSTKALNHRIKYLRELVIISHKNGYKPPKNIVAELNELIAIKKVKPMENEKIKAIVKEAIDEERKERSKQIRQAILDALLSGTIGALLFVAAVIVIVTFFGATSFISGIAVTTFAIIDAFLINSLLQLNYETNQEIERLNKILKQVK